MELLREKVDAEILAKLQHLEEYIKGLGSLAVGFSGGVDSSFLLVVAHGLCLKNGSDYEKKKN